jgi:hypothetical protein
VPEQVSVAAMTYISISKILGSNFRQDTGYLARDFSCLSSALEANVGIVSR